MNSGAEIIDADTVLRYVGNFGRYQAILMGLFSVINVLSAFHYFGQTFISIGPPTCDITPNSTELKTCSNENDTVYMYGYTSIAQKDGSDSLVTVTTSAKANPEKTLMSSTYIENADALILDVPEGAYFINQETELVPIDENILLHTCINESTKEDAFATDQDEISLKPKDNGPENSQNKNSDTMETSCGVEVTNLVDVDSWVAALGQSMFFVGSVVGSLILGSMADRLGRLHVLVIANLLAMAGNVSSALVNNTILFTLSRFIAGLACDSNFVMMYILVMEYTKPSSRTFALNLCIGVWYCIGCAVVPWLAVAVGTWRHLLLAIAAPHLLAPALYLLVPESAAWLLSRGRAEKAVLCYQRIAAVNHRQVDDRVYEGLKHYAKNHIEKAGGSLWGLFKTPKLRRKTFILIFKSMVITLCYDAISRNINSVDYSPFVLFSITSLTIFPACLFILILQDRVGRKAMASASLFVSGLMTLCIGLIFAFYSESDPFVTVCLLTISRFGITVAYNSAAQYAVELIPVAVRGQGVSFVHVVGYAASFFSPQLLYAARWWKPLPDISIGILLLLGAASCLMLPETLGRVLPITLQDGEEFGEDEKIWEFPFTKRTESQQTLKFS